eukprot:TRINITY_DN8890_c0_g2_i2.p1 TRINITY_DN8890_c0_g2~~TRINITY_DN8890_c0_g2_i2.p1  ORF type:complete len:813 (+),score=272.56 TRINITY_DN8890_c0_g2_i2:43-2439(+)
MSDARSSKRRYDDSRDADRGYPREKRDRRESDRRDDSRRYRSEDRRGDDRSYSRDRNDPRSRDDHRRRDDGSRDRSSRDDDRKSEEKSSSSISKPATKHLPAVKPTIVAEFSTSITPDVISDKQPLSLEELMQKKAKEQEEASKPKFLSKKQREKQALSQREQQVKLKQEREEARRRKRDMLDSSARATRYSNQSTALTATKPFAEPAPAIGAAGLAWQDEAERDSELKTIKARYFGGKKEKRRIRRMNEKKFVFDWDDKDDTSRDYNPLYANKHEAQLFGRGHVAGIDVLHQRKEKGQFYDDLLEERRSQAEKDRLLQRQKVQEEKRKRQMHDARHWSEKALADMTNRDWRIFREDYNISCKGGHIPPPLRQWSEADLHPDLLKVIDVIGYTNPTPIQRAGIPIGLNNRDVIGVAQTGSGKTLAFVLPLLNWIISLPKLEREQDIDNGPYAIIMAPTRELALQIEEETNKFAKVVGVRTVAVIGGASREEQSFRLNQGCEVVIATPGRLIDVLENQYMVLNQCSYVVLDEADRMLDMGFEPEVQKVLEHLPVSNEKPDTEEAEDLELLRQNVKNKSKYRQTVLFTATMPVAVERLAKTYLRRPAIINIGSAGKAADKVEQKVYMMTEKAKKNKLLELLESFEPPVVIFVNQKGGADALAKSLNKLGFRAAALHGGKNQELREHALASIKDGSMDILVGTDVLGRGIDIPDVSMVINFDMAKNIEAYTHRIGRTGRAGKSGVAVTFLTEDDSKTFYDLRMMLKASVNSVCPKELDQHKEAQVKPGTAVNKYGRVETLG